MESSAYGFLITVASSGSGIGLVSFRAFFFLADLGGLGLPNFNGRLTPIIFSALLCSALLCSATTDELSDCERSNIPFETIGYVRQSFTSWVSHNNSMTSIGLALTSIPGTCLRLPAQHNRIDVKGISNDVNPESYLRARSVSIQQLQCEEQARTRLVMETIGVVIYCQGFILPSPYDYAVREMGLCDLSGKHHQVFHYENSGPAFQKLSKETKETVEQASDVHGVPYEPKYPARPTSCLTDDFDQFIAKYASKANVGVWAGDAVGRAFMEGLGVSTVVIKHADLEHLPLGCVIDEDARYRNRNCSSHHLRRYVGDDDDQMHRCSLEYACALAALVRKETHYRSPTLVDDLLYQKNLWQWRTLKLLDVVMCSFACQAEMGRAFEKGQGLEYYTDCDTQHCWWVKRLFRPGVFEPLEFEDTDFADSTLDTLTVLTPTKKND